MSLTKLVQDLCWQLIVSPYVRSTPCEGGGRGRREGEEGGREEGREGVKREGREGGRGGREREEGGERGGGRGRREGRREGEEGGGGRGREGEGGGGGRDPGLERGSRQKGTHMTEKRWLICHAYLENDSGSPHVALCRDSNLFSRSMVVYPMRSSAVKWS